jgi:hypothetical protein
VKNFHEDQSTGEAEEAASLASYAVANIRAQESRLAALTEAVRRGS